MSEIWTTPITWANATVYTNTNLNQQIRDNMEWLLSGRRNEWTCILNISNGQSFGSGADTNVVYDVEVFDPNGMHSTVSNTERITIPTGGNGLWLWTCFVQIHHAALGSRTGVRRLYILHSSGNQVAYYSTSDQGRELQDNYLACSGAYSMAAAEYVRAVAFQSSGVTATINKTILAGVRL
jgi:hypothetical protein